MAERKTKVVDGQKCYASEYRAAGWETYCIICGEALVYWSNWSSDDANIFCVTCEACNLIEMRKERRARCGFIWYKFDMGGWYPADGVAEAKRLHADTDESAVRPDNPDDHTAWAVFADWLDEHDYPLNAAAIRTTAVKHMGGASDVDDTLRPPGDVPEGEDALHDPNDQAAA